MLTVPNKNQLLYRAGQASAARYLSFVVVVGGLLITINFWVVVGGVLVQVI